jgi:hypothetical protein
MVALVPLVAVFMGLISGTAAAAGSHEPSREAEPMVLCPGGQCLVTYSDANYGGSSHLYLDTIANGCFSVAVRSYDNRDSRLEGYFYAGPNCDGSVIRTVNRGSQSPDIGGTAYSFKVACVSCRSEG